MIFFKKIPLRQIPELDSIRFISIVLVVLHHQFFESNPVLKWFADHGWVGVDIFFGMSGYLITTLLIKELHTTKKINLGSFWFRRILRLWPSWFLTLLASFLMVYFIARNNPPLHEALLSKWWHYLLHFGNYSYSFLGKLHILYSHFWSLAVEEHFYLIWPLVLYFVRTRRGIVSTAILLIVASFFFRLFHIMADHSLEIISCSTHTRMDELLMGCLLAFYMPKIKNLSLTLESFLTIVMITLFYVGLNICKENADFPVLNALTYTVIGIATCILVVIALKGGKYGVRSIFQFSVFARLGVLSYGVYLIHLHTNGIVFGFLKNFSVHLSQNIIAFINVALPFIPAFFMYFYVDEFFARFKHAGNRSKTKSGG